MKAIKLILLWILVFGVIQACSFRSTQLDLIMSAFNGTDNEVNYEELAWTLIWSGNDFSLIPVFTNDMSLTNFIDREATVVVSFDGWQVVRADGVLPAELNVAIEKTDMGLEYAIEDEIFAVHACEEFTSSVQGGTTVWLQNCDSLEGTYTNEIRVNNTGSISLLRFLIHPAHPMISMTPNNFSF
ncbi:MAG: hypothetical protein ACJ0BT_01755 [Pseudohongiellaceae bacterium]